MTKRIVKTVGLFLFIVAYLEAMTVANFGWEKTAPVTDSIVVGALFTTLIAMFVLKRAQNRIAQRIAVDKTYSESETRSDEEIGARDRYEYLELQLYISPTDWPDIMEYLYLAERWNFSIDKERLHGAVVSGKLITLAQPSWAKIHWDPDMIKKAALLIEKVLESDLDQTEINIFEYEFQRLRGTFGKHHGYEPMMKIFRQQKKICELIDSSQAKRKK